MTDDVALRSELLGLLKASAEADNGTDPKDSIRTRYESRRRGHLLGSRSFVRAQLERVVEHFADGADVDPGRIAPRLEPVHSGTVGANIFRIATLFWSVPPSQGFGRRARFLVRDESNDKVIGIIALGDPVFNLAARDRWIGWTAADRVERLRFVFDAFTLGSVPPYSFILGGKLLASLLSTDELVYFLQCKYAGKQSVIRQKGFGPPVVFTTTSALGRSSVYNRVSLAGERLFEPIGWTGGFGHFQISNDMFTRLRSVLRDRGHKYADGHSYGTGPNWRMRVIRAAVSELGINDDELLNHGVRREVFGIPLVKNFRAVLTGSESPADWLTQPVATRARQALDRWVLPRAQRETQFASWKKAEFVAKVMRSLEEVEEGSASAIHA